VLENSIFYTLALFLLGGSVAMVSSRHTVFSAISFLLAMVALAGMFALLQSSFLFLAQLLVAVGAVVTLSLLVIASVNISDRHIPSEPYKNRWFILSALLVVPLNILLIKTINRSTLTFADVDENFGSLKEMGEALFSHWVLPFELISILLLVALVAAIVISQKRMDSDA
jgi:NADH-quinone oxidoreductase subunit J